MKCFIKRNNMYYKHYLGLDSCKIHWVADRQEAKLFESVKEARQEIRINKIKNVEVVKI